MAKPTWINVSKSHGTGNDKIDIIASSYTGRTKRSGIVTATATGGGHDSSTVEQLGKSEFIQIVSELSATADKSGQIITISGKSNCANLKVSSSGIDELGSIPGLVYALEINGEPDTNWDNTESAVSEDPGATAEYDFTLKITVPANKTEIERGNTFIISNANMSTSSDSFSVTQQAGVKTYAVPEITEFKYSNVIPAGGGSVIPTLSYKQTWGWNGSTTDGGTLSGTLASPLEGTTFVFSGATEESTGKVTATSKGTTVSEITKIADVTAKVTVNGKSSAIYDAQAVNQAANEIFYGDIAWGSRIPSVQNIPASGGNSSAVQWSGTGVICSQTISYSSGSEIEITNENASESPVFDAIAISYSQEVNADSKGTIISGETEVGSVIVTATGAGGQTAEKSVIVKQDANVATYGAVTINEDTPIYLSAGGQTYQIDADARQTVTYSSGATRTETSESNPVNISIDYSIKIPVDGFSLDDLTGEVTVESNPAASTRGGFVVTISAEGEGGKSASKDITFNQQSAESTISLTPSTLSFEAAGGTQELIIESNDSWIIS